MISLFPTPKHCHLISDNRFALVVAPATSRAQQNWALALSGRELGRCHLIGDNNLGRFARGEMANGWKLGGGEGDDVPPRDAA